MTRIVCVVKNSLFKSATPEYLAKRTRFALCLLTYGLRRIVA
jgi:hypothetical protein